MKSIIKKFAALALTVGMLAGCTSKPAESTNTATVEPTNAPSKAVELKLVSSFGGDDSNREVYEDIYTNFAQANNVTIKNDSQKSDETWKTKVLADFSTNSEPDVLFYFSGVDADTIVESGKLVDIDTIRSQYPDYCNNINQSVINDMKSVDGKSYFIPVTGYWEGLYINEDLFIENNIKVPETWTEFLDAVTKFKAAGIVPVAVALANVPHYWFEFLIFNHTGLKDHLSSVPTDANNLPQSWVEGLTEFKTLYDMGAFPENTNSATDDDTVMLFQQKKAAMLIDGSWKAAAIEDKENVKLVPFPAENPSVRQSTDMIGGFSMGFGITQKCWDDADKREMAVKLVEEYTSNENVVRFNANGAAAPISESIEVSGTPLLQSIVATNSIATGYVGAVQDTVKKEAREQLFDKIPSIATGKISVEDALKEFVADNQ